MPPGGTPRAPGPGTDNAWEAGSIGPYVWEDDDAEPGDLLTPAQVIALARADGSLGGDDEDDPAWRPGADKYEDAPIMAGAGVPEVWEAGFLHNVPGEPGCGFASGGVLDRMLPGRELAAFTGTALRDGLGLLDDFGLIGFLCAARRNISWQQAAQLAAVADLDARRAGRDGAPGEHVADEVAAALNMAPRAAEGLLALAAGVMRLSQVPAALAAGVIDLPRAEVFVRELLPLDDALAVRAEAMVMPRAPQMTTGQLASALRHAVAAVDPAAAERRKKRAQQDARVEVWMEPGRGTAAVAGRDLPAPEVIAADKRLTAAARWLKARGAAGTTGWLRSRACLAFLNGYRLDDLLAGLLATQEATREDTASPGVPSTDPASADGAPVPAGLASPADPPGLAALTGTVNLTMPAAAWLGLADTPGETGGFGALDASTCRDLATALAAHRTTRWCITLLSTDGKPVAHGCARAGPGPPGPGTAAWLATIKITPIETGTCQHRRQTPGYQPSNLLRHIIKTRSRRCGFPGCRRPAVQCDDDHTVPYDKGGRTCECNLHPLCRRHHQAKQAPGWHLDQPQPGTLVWTLPSGRQYTVTPDPYPV